MAKATEFSLTDLSLADTGAIVGTPTYMSPEQADPSSMDIDTRTDIYALGVILYELLAGSPPIDAKSFKRGAFLEMLRMVREVEPPSPSTALSKADDLPGIAASRGLEPAQLRRALRGDLDWIVLKALEKDRTRRYETANGFAADVVRHLASEPVLAAPPGRAYRMRKFARKHRGAVVAADLVVFTLLAGIVGTTLGLIAADAAAAGGGEEPGVRDQGERDPRLDLRGAGPASQLRHGGRVQRRPAGRPEEGGPRTGRCGDRRPACCCGHAGQTLEIAHCVGGDAGCDCGPEEIPRDPEAPTWPRPPRNACKHA